MNITFENGRDIVFKNYRRSSLCYPGTGIRLDSFGQKILHVERKLTLIDELDVHDNRGCCCCIQLTLKNPNALLRGQDSSGAE
ncbi:hypothetical protein T05_7261 [Trichinella murrelli]|uniref:Uncharacterized protein n=1 Tax=Trichinella murrelli TaxID=144512 RepID=A0A0V0TA86_9BILA|nr:hypothetical protein T05_7261 [Trichinella murrelli]